MRSILAAAYAFAALFVFYIPARADAVETFYRGRSITLIVGFNPGGSNDFVGRLLSRFMGEHIPGRPAIVVQNMPGAGGLVAANHLYNVAIKDGSVIGQIDRAVPLTGLRGAANTKFDPLRFTWLGSLSTYRDEAYVIWLSPKRTPATLAELQKSEKAPRIGVVSGGSNNLVSKIARDVLGLNIRIVPGYPGAPAIWHAFETGEIDGHAFGLTPIRIEKPQLWAAGELRGLVSFGNAQRLSTLPDVPTARELAGGDATKLALIELAELPFFMAQPFIAPPGVPADRATALQQAFLATVANPAFIAEAKRLNVELSPAGADAIRARLTTAAAVPKETMAEFNRILEAN